MQTNEHRDWVSLSEAAELLDCSVDTVRRRLKRGDLESRKLHTRTGYRWEVRLGSPPRQAQVGKSESAQADTYLVQDQTQRQLEVLRDTLVLPLIAENRELHREVGDIREELGRERERREQAERERDRLQARLEALERPESHETRSPDSAGHWLRPSRARGDQAALVAQFVAMVVKGRTSNAPVLRALLRHVLGRIMDVGFARHITIG